MSDENTPRKSEFNEANLQIMRLHGLSIQYAQCWISNADYNKATWILDQIWVELYPDAMDEDKGKEEQDTFSNKIIKLDEKIFTAKSRVERYKALQEKRMLLRYLQELSGKGSKKSKRSRKVM